MMTKNYMGLRFQGPQHPEPPEAHLFMSRRWRLPGATRPSAGPCKRHLLPAQRRLAWPGVLSSALWRLCGHLQQGRRRGEGAGTSSTPAPGGPQLTATVVHMQVDMGASLMLGHPFNGRESRGQELGAPTPLAAMGHGCERSSSIEKLIDQLLGRQTGVRTCVFLS